MSTEIKKISIKIVKPEERGITHNSREDVRRIGQVINILIDKINEIIEQLNKNP